MSNTMSSSEWVQFHQQTIPAEAEPSTGLTDATTVTTSVNSESTILNENSLGTSSDQFNHKSTSPSKPTRRRSKASKKTPTTHLNANATNFRALVQQFTGCPSVPSSFGTQRGPVNLNFGHGSDQNHGSATSIMAPFEYSYYNQQSQPLQQQQQEHPQLYHQQQQAMFSMDNITSDVFFSNISNQRPSNNMELEISLHELTMDSSFNGYRNDGSNL